MLWLQRLGVFGAKNDFRVIRAEVTPNFLYSIGKKNTRLIHGLVRGSLSSFEQGQGTVFPPSQPRCWAKWAGWLVFTEEALQVMAGRGGKVALPLVPGACWGHLSLFQAGKQQLGQVREWGRELFSHTRQRAAGSLSHLGSCSRRKRNGTSQW